MHTHDNFERARQQYVDELIDDVKRTYDQLIHVNDHDAAPYDDLGSYYDGSLNHVTAYDDDAASHNAATGHHDH